MIFSHIRSMTITWWKWLMFPSTEDRLAARAKGLRTAARTRVRQKFSKAARAHRRPPFPRDHRPAPPAFMAPADVPNTIDPPPSYLSPAIPGTAPSGSAIEAATL